MIHLHRKHFANDIYFTTGERFITNRTCVSEEIHLVEYAFPPIRVYRYAHDDSAELVSTSKLTARLKLWLPEICAIDSFRLLFFIYQVFACRRVSAFTFLFVFHTEFTEAGDQNVIAGFQF